MRGFGILLVVSMIGCGASTPIRESTDETEPAGAEPETEGESADDPTGTATGEAPAKSPTKPTPPSKPSTPSVTPVTLRWNALGNYVYSLDVKTPTGDWVGPCLDASIIGAGDSVIYKGVCTSSAKTAVPKPAAYRLYFSRSNTDVQHWVDFVEVTPTNAKDDVVFKLPTTAPSGVNLTWNTASATAEYSLDVFLMNGEQIRPCIGSKTLGKSSSFLFDGHCTGGPTARQVDLRDVRDFVLCSAEQGHWDSAVCKGVPYSGYGTSRTITY